jgi:RND superfamily putative drug exporter
MYQFLAVRIVRNWKFVICFWILLAVCANGVVGGWINRLHLFRVAIPRWNEIVDDGEEAFLPARMPTIQAAKIFRKAFPADRLSSNAVVILERESGPLTDKDRSFIEDEVTPRLEAIEKEQGSIISQVRDFNDKQIGQLLNSQDGKATLIVVELKNDFLDLRNTETIDRIEQLVTSDRSDLHSKIPEGLQLALSGSAAVGGDMLSAAQDGARRTQMFTVVLVIGLLLIIYRAPFVALIPLVTVFISMQISMAILILLTWAGQSGGIFPFTLLKPFSGLQTYVTVVVYGAGVDYCLFLLARYKEEFDRGASVEDALTHTLRQVGSGLVASASTVACGIGMMVFAWFGKFQQAGITMAFSLVVMLFCALTLTPALLRLAGKHVFWPHASGKPAVAPTAANSKSSFFSRWFSPQVIESVWESVASALMKRPGVIWVSAVAIMLPFAIIGVKFHDNLSYGLLSELPQTTSSVEGARVLQEHFAAGQAGPLTVLLYNPKLDFSDADTFDAIDAYVQDLTNKKDDLGLADLRSVVNPLGLHVETSFVTRGVAKRRYISTADGFADHVVRLDLILNEDPFSRDSMRQLKYVELQLQDLLPKSIQSGTELYFIGTTPSLLDLKAVTDRDQLVIDGAVLAVVLLILIVLLRMFAVSCYLVLSVFFSYFVSLGMTISLFWLIDPQFAGIDWKVPIFLFTILVAVGQDYNIFLMSRVKEDQQIHGPVKGIQTAMLATGSIISSCGIIMAGTFFSLVLAGQLRGSQQLGTALTLGVLLDTFVIRPVLVPAWLIMLNTNRFGIRIGSLLGATTNSPPLNQPPAGLPQRQF